MTKAILVVDDSASIRMVVGVVLKEAGYDVIEACDGKDALAKVGGRKFHLVISDVNMPNMDGISFVKALKEDTANKFTPVIMLTTEAGADKKSAGQAAGAKAWLVKPFQPAQMLAAVSKLVMP